MSKFFICLANSFKAIDNKEHNNESGRCIAGVEITYPDCNVVLNCSYGKRPNWIRPCAKTVTGAIPISVAKQFNLLDIIKIEDPISKPDSAHSENYEYSSIERVGKYEGSLASLIDTVHKNTIFGSGLNSIDDEYFKKFNYSLMLIRPANVNFYFKSREINGKTVRKLRVHFDYGVHEYDLPITDPLFSEECYKYRDDQCKAINDLQREYYFSLSLGMNKDGRHYKLVAAVLF